MTTNGKRLVYADNAATTAVLPEVLEAILPCYKENYGNPSSLYSIGTRAQETINSARETVASLLGAQQNEIYFTGSGTESDNWAVKCTAQMMAKSGKRHIITSKFEHHAVLHACMALEKEGFEVTYLDVYENGIVRPAELEAAIREDTALVTIMYANNEIGTIQPISEIGAICKKHGVLFHTDAIQAVGKLHINVKEQNIDMLSVSAHKLHGPKGVGALYIRNGVRLPNFIDGGAQERNRRGGTENVAGIVGLAKAMEIACMGIDKNTERLTKLHNRLIDEILKIERSRLNGDRDLRVPQNASFCFEGVEGESLLLYLDMEGISASSGSACTSGSLDPSHVLLSLGLPHAVAHGSLRLSFSDETTDEDIDYIIRVLPGIVERIRKMSPLWDAIQRGKIDKDYNIIYD